MAMGKEIIYAKEVELFLNELLLLLFEKGYFSYPENAKSYVDKIFTYVEKNIGMLSDRDAPSYFIKIAKNLKYITYRANKSTTWYVLYQQRGNLFLIRYITNNHVAAQHFG